MGLVLTPQRSTAVWSPVLTLKLCNTAPDSFLSPLTAHFPMPALLLHFSVKIVSSAMLKCCLLFIRTTRKRGSPSGRQTLFKWETMLININVHKRMFLNRNTYKIRFCIDQLIKMWAEAFRNSVSYFFLEKWPTFS